MKYEVIVSRMAEETLLLHVRFLSNVSIRAAKILRDAFKETIGKLSSNPFQFQEELDLNLPKGKYRWSILLRRYKVVFFVKGNKVFVDAVVDCRQSDSF